MRDKIMKPFLYGWIIALTIILVGCGDDNVNNTTPDTSAGADAASDTTTDTTIDTTQESDAVADACAPDDCPTCGDGVCDDGEDLASCAADCDPVPRSTYDPSDGALMNFPDDFFTVDDGSTLSGLRVSVSPDFEAVLNTTELLNSTFDLLNTLDGFGTAAGAYLNFSVPLDLGSLPSGEATLAADSSVIFGYLDDAGAFVRVPVELSFVDLNRTVIMRPMIPLPPLHRAVAAITTSARGVEGDAATSNPLLASLLAGEATAPYDRLNGRYAEAVTALSDAGAIGGRDDIASMVVFTTQSIFEDNNAIVERIKGETYSVDSRDDCEVTSDYRECVIYFEVGYYRDEAGYVTAAPDGGPLQRYLLTAQVYLPLVDTHPMPDGGYPTLIFGHGLSSRRHEARSTARLAADRGIATIAIDAPEHGDHPLSQSDDMQQSALNFLGLSLAKGKFEAVRLRDNWRQATHDKLAMLGLLSGGVDVDGDSVPDLASDFAIYMGASLGAIMAPELLAYTDYLPAAVLVVGGARLIDIVRTSPNVAPLITVVKPRNMTESDIERFWIVAQTAIERGDPANFSKHVFTERLDDAPPVHVISGMVLDDDTVTQPTNLMLARSLGVPHIPPALVPAGVIPIEESAPVSANHPQGNSAGLLQSGGWNKAGHHGLAHNEVSATAWFTFIETFLETGTPVIINPYDELGLTRP